MNKEKKITIRTDAAICLPKKVKQILDRLHAYGYEAYAVGGCIRDSLLGRTPKDWDITTSAVPAQVKELFPKTADTGLQHGTVTVIIGREGFEVTTYRIDGEYTDGRHPKEVIFTPSLLEDLKRRDFTINAMAYDETHGLVDAFHGVSDLTTGMIRCVGDPLERFQEDALRMLRAVRFAAQLDFQMEQSTQNAVRRLANDLSRISAERIQAELVKLVASPHPEYMKELYQLGISRVILPEFDRMMETGQNHPHHCKTVGEHTITAMCHIAPDKILRLAALFHDIAKPLCKTTDEEQVRRAVVKTGQDQYPAIFALKRADVLAQSEYQRKEKLDYIDRYEQLYKVMKEKGDCISLKQLAVTGRDMIALGIKPGRQIGEILALLLEQVMKEPGKNERTYLLEQAEAYIKNHSRQADETD